MFFVKCNFPIRVAGVPQFQAGGGFFAMTGLAPRGDQRSNLK